MGLTEAKRYIEELHKKQENPFLWPDYLTGLHDKAAIIRKLQEVYPKLGQYSIAYVRIANIHPYLIKYGPNRHAEIIQWAAAILKTTCDQCKKCFVGTLSTHDFIIICETKNMAGHIREAGRIFKKKIQTYYNREDLQSKTTLSFTKDGKNVKVGLIRLVTVIADKASGSDKSHLIQEMGKICEAMEGTEDEIIFMSDDSARREL